MQPDPQAILDREGLIAAVSAGWRPKYVLFWGHRGPADRAGQHVLSQWWPAAFEIAGQRYPTAEHYMMAEKARLFGDAAAALRIVAAASPGAAKAIGREVRNYDEATWVAQRLDIVVRGNLAKFGQNPALAAYLSETGNKVQVEASPVDRIWGIGLGRDDPAATDPARWPGLNLLGFALMRVRSQLTP